MVPLDIKARVVVAMSGGVDSSVAALLLKEQGYDVVGVTMRLFPYDEASAVTTYNKGCCTPQDVDDARRVCQIVGIPHYLMNFEREFKEFVIDYFCEEYTLGRTPHPCLACNDKIKFSFLFQRAMALKADYIATGHYARIRKTDGVYHLLKGIDPSKDQSYVLFNLDQQLLERTLLPVGWYPKHEIRDFALKAGLPVADKADSQEICFIPDGDYRSFINDRVKTISGDIVDIEGKVIGAHQGIQNFTVGQRKGLGLATGKPLFVIGVNANNSQVIVGGKEQLLSDTLWASRVNFVVNTPSVPTKVTAKIRYKALEEPASLFVQGGSAVLKFERPQRAVTPGQAVAFYKEDELIGGGIIEGQYFGDVGQIDSDSNEMALDEISTKSVD
ncbi:MAG: tRNA-specific 2-thiouridylase [Chloroflexi bacterium]|jgi:tRNA-specific 2-thiouridylase|nr:MAG: tRNA-specific 2-thiouridylase [Chloroflexota bacterium]